LHFERDREWLAAGHSSEGIYYQVRSNSSVIYPRAQGLDTVLQKLEFTLSGTGSGLLQGTTVRASISRWVEGQASNPAHTLKPCVCVCLGGLFVGAQKILRAGRVLENVQGDKHDLGRGGGGAAGCRPQQ
jgi:hypothetical protein